MVRIKIPRYAKQQASKALIFNKNNPRLAVGLTKQESQVLGIASGIARAKQIIKNQTLSLEDARKVRNFYNRFKGGKSKRVEMAINLWGGRKFGKYVSQELKNIN